MIVRGFETYMDVKDKIIDSSTETSNLGKKRRHDKRGMAGRELFQSHMNSSQDFLKGSLLEKEGNKVVECNSGINELDNSSLKMIVDLRDFTAWKFFSALHTRSTCFLKDILEGIIEMLEGDNIE